MSTNCAPPVADLFYTVMKEILCYLFLPNIKMTLLQPLTTHRGTLMIYLT